MKYSNIILTTIIMFTVFAMAGCDSPSNKMDKAETSVIEANRDLEIAKSEVEAELAMYRAENADRIMAYNRTISNIKEKINSESNNDVKERYESKLAGFEDTHRDLKREMDNFEAKGRENWDDFKDSFSSRMDDLGNSLNDFFSTTN